MAYYQRKMPQTGVGSGSDSALMIQSFTADADGSGTTSTFTFATVGCYNMATTNYQVLIHPQGTFTAHPYVSSKTTTTIVITHDNNYDKTIDVVIIGPAKRA